ncbi:hypothetical protein BJY01DRAFT_220833 [Aspergillus pseudoustus]|uniref:Oxidoreductase n=1 Tax=Aspergillus pseudoustus TaxID=1810923 RepID=A0ABR4JC81_9EURO
MTKPFDSTTSIPSLTGKTILLTGGNTGIGKATLHALALHSPAHIYLCGRRRTASESAAADIAAQASYPRDRITVLELDLASLSSVAACAAQFAAREERLHLLFLNAGIASTPPATTEDGYERQFGVNHMGHALLVMLLLPILLRTRAEKGDRDGSDGDVRIIATASNAAFVPFLPKHEGKRGLLIRDDDAIRSPTGGSGAGNSPFSLYAHSKLANVLFIRGLARAYPGLILAAAVHPGFVKTEIWGKGAGGFMSMLLRPVLWAIGVDAWDGAKSQLWAATAPRRVVESGGYYEPVGKRKVLDSGPAADDGLVDELWEWTSRELVRAGYAGKGWPAKE